MEEDWIAQSKLGNGLYRNGDGNKWRVFSTDRPSWTNPPFEGIIYSSQKWNFQRGSASLPTFVAFQLASSNKGRLSLTFCSDLIYLLSEPISHTGHLAAVVRSFYFENISVAPSKNNISTRNFRPVKRSSFEIIQHVHSGGRCLAWSNQWKVFKFVLPGLNGVK